MTDASGERTQPPTERRRREARARGDVARSSDLVAASVLLVAVASLWWLGPDLTAMLARTLREGLSASAPMDLSVESASRMMTLLSVRVLSGVIPVLLITLAAAALGSLVQTGFLWTPARLLPKFERLDPMQGLSRCVSWTSWFNVAMGLGKLLVLLAVLIGFVRIRLSSAGPLVQVEPEALLGLAARMLGELGLYLAVTLFVLALADYGWQFWRHEQSLMMTVEEVRREQREESIDPQLKRARNSLAAEAASPITAVRS